MCQDFEVSLRNCWLTAVLTERIMQMYGHLLCEVMLNDHCIVHGLLYWQIWKDRIKTEDPEGLYRENQTYFYTLYRLSSGMNQLHLTRYEPQ